MEFARAPKIGETIQARLFPATLKIHHNKESIRLVQNTIAAENTVSHSDSLAEESHISPSIPSDTPSLIIFMAPISSFKQFISRKNIIPFLEE